MKKFSALVLILILLFSLIGCSRNGNSASTAALTDAEIDRVNAAFQQLLPTERNPSEFYVNPLCAFLTSYYETPEDMDLLEFLSYFSTQEMLDQPPISEAELQELKKLEGFWFPEAESLEALPVPITRKPREQVDQVLETYLGISSDQLNGDGCLYLGEPYNSFYVDASDLGAGYFTCIGGEIQGNRATLHSDTADLVLEQQDGQWHIVSYTATNP